MSHENRYCSQKCRIKTNHRSSWCWNRLDDFNSTENIRQNCHLIKSMQSRTIKPGKLIGNSQLQHQLVKRKSRQLTADALNKIIRKRWLPFVNHLWSCYGIKGGAAGGGYAQVLPMVIITFTLQDTLVTTANNASLSASLIIHISPRKCTRYWPQRRIWNVVDPTTVRFVM